jgi:hypothetical protein
MKRLAIIVGRFQTYSIEEHLGYNDILIKNSLELASSILFIIGSSQLIDIRNPLNFKTRKHMIEGYFIDSDRIGNLSGVINIDDVGNDENWSSILDSIIINHCDRFGINLQDVILVGSRDSFLYSYMGAIDYHLIESSINFSSSNMRYDLVANFNNNDFYNGFFKAAFLAYHLTQPITYLLKTSDERKGFIFFINSYYS